MTFSVIQRLLYVLFVTVFPLVLGNFANRPSGACCIIEHEEEHVTRCIEVPGYYCQHIGGDYIDDFVRCQPNRRAHPCVGACCTAHGCVEVVESHCNKMNGAWTRAGTRCNNTGNFCPPSITGACCYKEHPNDPHDFGSCKVETFVDCYSGKDHPKGEFWTNGTNCDIPGVCPFLLVPYQQSLPIPKTLKPKHGKSGCAGVLDGDYSQILHPQDHHHPRAEYEIEALAFEHKYYPHFPNSQSSFGYEEQIPGPLIEACHGVPISVKYVNKLPEAPHPLGFDTCVHGTDFLDNVPYTSIHLHGAHNPTRFDGWPEALVYPGEEYYYYYENLNQPCCLFYHDHALGITRKNIVMGLTGTYIIRNPHEPELPSGKFEIPLLLQDKSFTYHDKRVELYYPTHFSVTVPFNADDFIGTNAIVNGVVSPYLEVSRAQYRFRIVNGANARSWVLHFVVVNEHGSIIDLPFLVIGSDQGFVFQRSVDSICLVSAERADIIFDFSNFKHGDKIWLINTAPIPFPLGTNRTHTHYYAIDSEYDLPELLEFRVNEHIERHPHIPIPHHLLKGFERIPPSSARMVRSFLLEDEWHYDRCNYHVWFIKRFKLDRHPEHGFMTESWNAMDYIKQHFIPLLGTVEIWEFWNPEDQSHPMHLHGYAFQILSSRRIVMDGHSTESMRVTDHYIDPLPTETAWKDTVEVHPYSLTSIIIKFEKYSGKFPLHCHVLEHEDNEMMVQFRVMDPEHPCHIQSAAKCGNGVCEAGNGENCRNCPFDCIGNHHFCCGWEESSDAHFIGCGPMRQLHQGQSGVCQRFKPHSTFEFEVTCRTDYVDHCCNDDGCGY